MGAGRPAAPVAGAEQPRLRPPCTPGNPSRATPINRHTADRMSTPQELTEQIRLASHWVTPLQNEIARVVVGQKALVEGAFGKLKGFILTK